MAEFDVDQLITRFQQRADAVKERNLPPVAGPERKRLIEQAEADFMDFALVAWPVGPWKKECWFYVFRSPDETVTAWTGERLGAASLLFLLESSLFVKSFKIRSRVVDVLHRVGDDMVPGHGPYLAMHLLRNPSIARMARRLSAQFQQVKSLSRIHFQHVANPEREWDDVLSNVRIGGASNCLVDVLGPAHDLMPLICKAEFG